MRQQRSRGASGRNIIRNLFLQNLGKVITREQIIAALVEGLGGTDYENWHQRLSELRTDEGYTILAARDRTGLRPGQYMMLTDERRPTAAQRVRPTTTTWQAVLRRAGNACEWNEAGIRCSLRQGEIDPIGGGTVQLTPDHMQPHSIDPNSDPNDPTQWQALCGRHQVTKRNYWDSTTGKLNVLGILQAASGVEKRRAFEMLLRYFGYTRDEAGNIIRE